MKKLIVIAMVVLTATSASGQNISSLFDEFRHEKHADYVSVSPFLLTIGKWLIQTDQDDDPEDIATKCMIKGMKSIKVLDLEECSSETKNRFQQAFKTCSTKGYEELVKVNDEDENVRILARMNGKMVKEFVIVTSGKDDCTLVQVTGRFSTDDIMNIIKEESKD